MASLSEAYLSGDAPVMALFNASPDSLWRVPPSPAPWNPTLVAAIQRYLAHIGCDALAPVEPAAAIVTGQQPALFSGPLYTVYKAATAILLARALETRYGIRCVPVYWSGSDDHDFAEARDAVFLSQTYEPFTLRYEPVISVDGLPLHQVPVEPSIHALIDQAANATRGGEYRKEVASFLHESLDASTSLAEWSTRILARLFAGTPLVFFDPSLPEARSLASGVFTPEILEPLLSTRLLAETASRIRALGFEPQVLKNPNECGFFLASPDGRRRKVIHENHAFHLPETAQSFTSQEMLDLLRDTPERFSPNVALRTLVQQALFPAAAYVAGPGEIAYWAQLLPLFERWGLPMPVVYPRARAILLSRKTQRLLNETGLTPDQLAAPEASLLETALRHLPPTGARRLLAGKAPGILASLNDLALSLSSMHPPAGPAATQLESHVRHSLDRLDAILAEADQARADATRKRVMRLRNEIAPFRKPQERVYTICSYLFEYGWELVPRLLESINLESYACNTILI